ncbi:DNA-binding domain-containing endonuclease [Escherichia phage Bf23]|uniref:DNA-binding domain-containing endonuclease n=1 Tax=Escherichia phage Bf23 TaxID=2932881 RepID=A0AAF0NTC5_BPBF2|nr:DNA-binding domain-containing endonuclease [Escherichia phage Bf23]
MKKLTQEEVESYLVSRGLFTNDKYTNTRTKMQFCCTYGHVFNATLNNIRNGRGCPYCYGNVRYTQEQVSEYLRSLGYYTITKYINNNSKLQLTCSKGHVWITTFSAIKNMGNRCPECSNIWSDGGILYIITSSLGTKIGITNSPARRLRDLITASGDPTAKYYGHYTYGSSSKSETLALEKKAHMYFKSHNCGYSGFAGSTEYFNISPEEAEEFLLKEGATIVQKGGSL